MNTFTVKRSTWFRGKGGNNSRLLRGDGTMCCLGFYGLECGLKNYEIKYKPYLKADVFQYINTVGFYGSRAGWLENKIPNDAFRALWSKIAEVNDNEDITDSGREKQLTELFALGGETVTFID